MKSLTQKISFKVLVLIAILSSSSAFAQDGMKVAVLDMAAALFNSEKARELSDVVGAETADDEQKVRDLAEEAQKLQQELQQNAAVMSEEDQRRSAEDIQELAVQYDFLIKKIETYVQQKRQEFQQTYAPNLIQAITELVEQENYDVVLRSEAALHYRAEYDITAQVTEKLNQQ